MAPTLLLELNELTPELIFRFMDEGRLPNFKRLHDESHVFTTDAQEEGLKLNPWVQWVTVHTGLPFSEHGVFLLGEGARLGEPSIGELASDAGLRVFLCGSMNIRPRKPIDGAFVPDAWATDVAPQPAELEPYFRFVSRNVQEHTNASVPLGVADYLDFLRFMLSHGLSLRSVREIATQLLRERSGQYHWKRVAILDALQWDVFRFYYRRLRPDFATFFLNSVAHLQHTHWRNLEPEKFTMRPSAEEQREFEDAILFGYQSQDRLIGEFLELAGDAANIVLCSALSQQPCLDWEDSGGKRFYRPTAFDELTAFAGIRDPHECAPVMSEEFWVEFQDERAASDGESRLAALRVDDRPAFAVSRKGNRVYAGCSIFDEIKEDAALVNPIEGTTVAFFDVMYGADSLKSGVHHPDGLLWIRTPERAHRIADRRVPLTAVAPTVLSLLGVDVPPSLQAKPLL